MARTTRIARAAALLLVVAACVKAQSPSNSTDAAGGGLQSPSQPVVVAADVAGAGEAAGGPGPALSNATAPDRVERRYTEQETKEMIAEAAKWKLTAEEARKLKAPDLAGKMSVCISPYTPDVFCDAEKPSTTYSGYGVQVFEEIAKRVPWLKDGTAWEYRCIEWNTMEADLASPTNACMLGLMMNPSGNAKWQSSRAINQDGLQILTRMKRTKSTKDLFSPFAAFTWQLWVLLFGTAFAVAIVLWLFDVAASAIDRPAPEADSDDLDAQGWESAEKGANGAASSQGGESAKKEGPVNRLRKRCLRAVGVPAGEEDAADTKLGENIRLATLHLIRTGNPPVGATLPATIVLWAWGLTSMICLSLYTGATAALMTTSSLTEGISDRSDLAGKAVGTWSGYLDKLRQTGIAATPYPWDSLKDERVMLDDLRGGRVAALVMDANFVQYVDGHDCDFATVGQPFQVHDVGLGISNGVNEQLIDVLNDAILSLVDTGVMEQLRDTHVNGLGGKCSAANFRIEKSSALRVSQVAGLWVVLGLAILAGVVMIALRYVRRRRAARAAQAIVHAARSMSKALSSRSAARLASMPRRNPSANGRGRSRREKAAPAPQNSEPPGTDLA